MERKWWSEHPEPLAARVPRTATVERQDPVRMGFRPELPARASPLQGTVHHSRSMSRAFYCMGIQVSRSWYRGV